MYHDSGRRISGPGCIIYWISGTTTGGIATGSWVQRRGGSLIRATSPDTTRKHPGSLRSGLRQQNRQEISNDPMSKSLPVAAPSPAPVATPQAHSPAATPPPTSISNSPAPTPLPVSRELKNEGYVEMPRKTCGDVSRNARHIAKIRQSPWPTIGSCGCSVKPNNDAVHHHSASKTCRTHRRRMH